MRRSDSRGSMPFAIVAVAILVASAACGALAAGYERSAEEARSGERDAEALDAAIENIGNYVNRGLAEIIRDVSGSGGTAEERVESFDGLAERWLEYQFPMVDDGVRAELVSHEVELGAKSLKLMGSGESPSGYVPAYLQATGTVSVRLATGTESADADLEVRTDGSFVLPLAAEQGSLFERMAGEGSVSLSQMMSYQLSSLAQLRVLNGYGSASQHGPMGTDRIITAEDVRKAYETSLKVLSMLCFRHGEDGMESAGSADPAWMLASEDGAVTVDLGAAYAQAVGSLIDDMAVKWYDYIQGDGIATILKFRLLPYRSGMSSLSAFLSGEDAFSAAPYLEETMELNGIPESEYRFPGSGTTVIPTSRGPVEFENPCADVLNTGWIRHFKSDYGLHANWVKDYAATVLRTAALETGAHSGAGSVELRADPYGGERLADSIARAVDGAMDALAEEFQESVAARLAETSASDPFYAAICSRVLVHRDAYVLEEEFRERAAVALSGIPEAEMEAILSGEAFSDAMEQYRTAVMEDLEVFADLDRMPKGQGAFVRAVMAEVCSFGLEASGITSLVRDRMSAVCSEMAGCFDMNPYGGPVALPGEPVFRVEREDGGSSSEILVPELSSSPRISDPVLVADECVHTVGFGERSAAAYSAVFRTTLADDVSYRLDGYGALGYAMGSPSCSVSGRTPVSITVDVRVVSGWSLKGIEYGPSSTLADDAWDAALRILEPVLEPLKKVMGIMGRIMASVGEKVADALRMAYGYAQELYDGLIGPLTEILEWAKASLDAVLSSLADSVGVRIGLGKQVFSASLFGYDVTVTTDAVSLAGKTKTLFTLEMGRCVEGRNVSAGVTLRTGGGIEADAIRFVGFGTIADDGSDGGQPWKVKVRMDPFMRSGKHALTVDGRAGSASVSLVIPEVVQYHELGLRLSDIPGLGEVLSNIPVPIPGAKASVDAGFSLKYDAPVKLGLLVNEMETNPPGEDSGAEWVELLNNSGESIDLDGYTLTASSDWRKKVMPLSGTIAPGEILLLEPAFTLVNSSGKYTRSGEALTIKDPDGAVVDKTPTVRDGDDDGTTWHREFDGGTRWVKSQGTPGTSNGGRANAVISVGDLKDIAWDAVKGAFDDVGEITGMESLGDFAERLVVRTVDGVIDKVSGCVVEASIYVEASVSDLAGAADAGFRVALRTDSQLAEDCLKFIAGKLEEVLLGISNPYSISIGKAFMEDVDLEVSVGAGVGLPELLTSGLDPAEGHRLEVVFRTNLAAVSSLIGDGEGRPEVVCGVRLCNCPLAAIPDGARGDRNMDRDLWLMRLSVRWRGPPPPPPQGFNRAPRMEMAWPEWTTGYRRFCPPRSSWRRPSTGLPR